MSGPGDTVRRGYQRWERAHQNALKHPDTKSAQLYFQRMRTASELAARAKNPLTIHAHVREWFDRAGAEHVDTKYYTCSVYCAGMQMQLDCAVETLEKLARVMEDRPRHYTLPKVINRGDLPRRVRCQVCGTTIERTLS